MDSENPSADEDCGMQTINRLFLNMLMHYVENSRREAPQASARTPGLKNVNLGSPAASKREN